MRFINAAFTCAFMLVSVAAMGQTAIDDSQLESLRTELAATAESVRDNLAATTSSMNSLFETGDTAEQGAVLGILDAMEVESRAILDKIKLNSPFRDELDRARAQVLVILRKQEREPPSPNRDSRVARLEAALAQVEEEYETLQDLEGDITFSLSNHAQVRRDIRLEGEVVNVQKFVDDLSELTANLERMVAVLDEVGGAILQPKETAVVQE